MAKHTYTAKRNEASGKWNVFDENGSMETRIGAQFDRSTARKFAFLLNKGRMIIPKRPQEIAVAKFVPTHDPVAPQQGERDFARA